MLVVTQPAILPEAMDHVLKGQQLRGETTHDLPGSTAQAVRRLGKPFRRWLRMHYSFEQLTSVPTTTALVMLDRQISVDESSQNGPPEELDRRHTAARLLYGEFEPLGQPELVGPRFGVLCSYRPDWTWKNGVECWKCDRLPPLPPDLYQPSSGRRRTVRLCVSEIDLSLGILEPMQLVVVLYNIPLGKRASESAVISLRPDHIPLPAVCNFDVWECVANDIVVVCRLEKVITGDAGVKHRDYGEARARATTGNEKKLLRLSQTAKRWSSNFEDYRSPLGIGALALVKALDPENALELYKWKTAETNVSEALVVQTSRELLEQNTGDRKHIGSASMKTAPSPPNRLDTTQCRQCLQDCASDDPRKLSYAAGDIIRVLATHDVGWWIGQREDVVGLFRKSDTEPVDYSASSRTVVGDLRGYATKLQSFHTSSNEPARNAAGFSNSMFLYPQRLCVDKIRNLALRVQLCDGADGRTNPISDQAFFSRYGDGTVEDGMRSVSDSYITCVHTRTKCCDFTDECRVDLPLLQNARQFILFTVLHINMKSSSSSACCSSRPRDEGRKRKDDIETVIGYACLPLYKTDSENACLIDDGGYRLRIHAATPVFEAPNRAQLVNDDEQEAMTLDVRVQSLSSIHATDVLASELIDVHARCVESRDGAIEQAKSVVLDMVAAPEDVKGRAATSVDFGAIADALFAFLAMPDTKLAEMSLKLMIDLVDHISGRHHRHSIPAWYIHHLNTFHSEGPGTVPLHERLCDLLADWMTNDMSIANVQRSSSHMWFFFDAIVKSIVNSGCSPGAAGSMNEQKTERYNRQQVILSNDAVVRLAEAVAALVRTGLSTHSSRLYRLNKDFGVFTKDLLSVISTSGHDAMLVYLTQLNKSPELNQLKWEYIMIVADHENWLQLRLSKVVLQSAVAAIKSEQFATADTAMNALCEILTKHSFDAHSNFCFDDNGVGQQEQYNAAIVGYEYFPFVLEVLDCVPYTHWSAPLQVNTDLLSCLLFIMQSLGPWVLYSWLQVECERRLRMLLRILEVVIIRFECPGRRADLSAAPNISAQVAVLLDDSSKQSYDDRLDTMYTYEFASSEAHYLTVLDVLTSIMDAAQRVAAERHKGSSNPLEALSANICKVLICMLSRQKLPLAVGFEALRCLEHYLVTYAEATLSPQFSAGAELSHCLLFLCSINGRKFRAFRQQATLVLFRYVQLSLLIMKRVSFPILTSHLTRGLATLSDKLSNDTGLVNSLQLLIELAQQDASNTARSITAEVSELSKNLERILSASAQLRTTDDSDVAAKLELYEELVEAYSGAKDLSVSWCIAQACWCNSHGNYAEAAAVYSKAACMLACQLEKEGVVPDGTAERLLRVIPWYTPSFSQSAHGNASDLDAKKLMLDCIEKAASAYKDGGCFETAVLSYQTLTHIYDGSLEFPKLAVLHGNIRSMFQLAIAAEASEARMLGTYFRVGFYGTEFGTLDEAQYVYKYPKITQIVEVKEAMVKMWSKSLKGVPVKVVSTSHPVEPSTLEGPHLQITHVHPVVGDECLTHYQKNTNITRFAFESPFTLDGKGQAAIDVQWVRRTILTVSTPFPCTLLRQLVTNTECTEMAPIANAIEIVLRRCRQLRKVANLDSGVFSDSVQLGPKLPNRNMLEQALCGSLLLQVNGGALEVAKSFLHTAPSLQGQSKEPNDACESSAGISGIDTPSSSDSELELVPDPDPQPAPEEEPPAKTELPEASDLRAALSDFLACCIDALGEYALAPSTQELLIELQHGLVGLIGQMATFGVFPPPASDSVSNESVTRPITGNASLHRRTNSFGRERGTMSRTSSRDRTTSPVGRATTPVLPEDNADRPVADLPGNVATILTRVRAAVDATRPSEHNGVSRHDEHQVEQQVQRWQHVASPRYR